ncbi:hypothetical protein FOA52_000415 [Chlamydomonas sp. UWO 241]|nr:hypothetical protein FOA52_000415 [Chlamydomonas sp. UWO 241]
MHALHGTSSMRAYTESAVAMSFYPSVPEESSMEQQHGSQQGYVGALPSHQHHHTSQHTGRGQPGFTWMQASSQQTPSQLSRIQEHQHQQQDKQQYQHQQQYQQQQQQQQPRGPGPVRLPHFQAWVIFIAYEGCMQIIGDHVDTEPHARHFLRNGMRELRRGFDISALLLHAVDSSGGALGNDICWDDQLHQPAVQAQLHQPPLQQQQQQPAARHHRPEHSCIAIHLVQVLHEAVAQQQQQQQQQRDGVEHQSRPSGSSDGGSNGDTEDQRDARSPRARSGSGPSKGVGVGAVHASASKDRWHSAGGREMMARAGGALVRVFGGSRKGGGTVAPPPARPKLYVATAAAAPHGRSLQLTARLSCGRGSLVAWPLDASGAPQPACGSRDAQPMVLSTSALLSGGGASSGGADARGGGGHAVGGGDVAVVRCSDGSTAGPMRSLAGARRGGQQQQQQQRQQQQHQQHQQPGSVHATASSDLRVELVGPGGWPVVAVGRVAAGRLRDMARDVSSAWLSSHGGGLDSGRTVTIDVPLFALDGGSPVGCMQLRVVSGSGGVSGSGDGGEQRRPLRHHHHHAPLTQHGMAATALDATMAASSSNAKPWAWPLRLNAAAAADAVMEAALRASSQSLVLDEPWRWLFQAFVTRYGVPRSHALISYLRRVVRPGSARADAETLTTVAHNLATLKVLQEEARRGQGPEAAGPGGLMPMRPNALADGSGGDDRADAVAVIQQDVTLLLQTAFERYGELRDKAITPDGGLAAGGGEATETLRAAFKLLEVMCGSLGVRGPGGTAWLGWLHERFRASAHQRWARHLAMLDAERGVELGSALRALCTRAPPHPAQHAQWGVTTGTGHDDAEPLLRALEALTLRIQSDVYGDLLLQAAAGDAPKALVIARVTTEVYVREFVCALDCALSSRPPDRRSTAAVDLLLAVSTMQQWLGKQGLLEVEQVQGHGRRDPRGGPGEVGSLNLKHSFAPHVQRWLAASREELLGGVARLEGRGWGGQWQQQQQQQQQWAGAPTPPPGGTTHHSPSVLPSEYFDVRGAAGGLLSEVVASTHAACMAEVAGYARLLAAWPSLARDVEAVVCAGLRAALGALKRQTGASASGAAARHGPGAQQQQQEQQQQQAQQEQAQQQRQQQRQQHAHQQAVWAHARAGVEAQHGQGAQQQQQQVQQQAQQQQQAMWAHANAHARALQPGALAAAGSSGVRQPQQRTPRTGVQVTVPESVLLNSLQYLMVAVPLASKALSDLCGGGGRGGGVSPSVWGSSTHGDVDVDGIGWQLEELVAELRSDFEAALTAAARRLMSAVAQQPGCGLHEVVVRDDNNSYAADHAAPLYPGAQPADASQQLGQQLAPLLAAVGEALRWLRACLEPRAFVAAARALWDMVGRALHDLVVVQHSQPGGVAHGSAPGDATAAPWRVRQRADGAMRAVSALFQGELQEQDGGSGGAGAAQAPAHVAKTERLLQRSSACDGMFYRPY